MKVETDYDPEFDITALKTFAIVHDGINEADTLNEERIREAITRELKAKEYALAPRKMADFHVTFHTSVEEDVPSNVSFGIGLGTYSGGVGASVGQSTRATHDRGRLTVNMIDPKTGKTFWHAAAADKIDRFESPQERTAYFNKSVAAMLADFPEHYTENKESR
jgi:hypothetical protein